MTVRISLDLPTHLYMQHEVVQRTSHKTFSPRYWPHPLLRTSIKPGHFHTRREGFGQLHIQLLSHCTGYCGPIRRQYSVMWYVAAPKIRIMTKYGIDNDINCQSRSLENCLWEENEHLKEKQSLASETVRGKLLCCSADWIDYNKSFYNTCLLSGIFQWGKGVQDGILLLVSLLIAIMRTS